MPTTYTPNLKLRLTTNLSADARYNLERLDLLGGTFLVDSTDELRLRSRSDILLEPESSELGGLGTGGTVRLGTLSHKDIDFLVNARLKVVDVAGSTYLYVRYDSNSDSGGADNADRQLTLDPVGANRLLRLSGDLLTVGHNITLTATDVTNVTLPTTGTLATLAGAEILTNKTINADNNSISNLANANIKASAAIARSKLATGSADYVVINSGTGAFSEEAQLATSRGGTGVNSTAVFPTSGTVVTAAGSYTLTNKTIDADANTLSNVRNTNVASDAAIAGTKIDPNFGGQNIQTTGQLRLRNSGFHVGFAAPSLSASQIWTLPDEDGAAFDVIETDGAGNLSFRTIAPSGGLTEDHVWIGNSSDLPEAVDTTSVGDVEADVTAGLTVKSGVLSNAHINASAAIETSKLEALTAGRLAYTDTNGFLDASPASVDGGTGDISTPGTIIASGTVSGNTVTVAGFTTNARAVATNTSRQLVQSATTATELGFLSGTTSSVQSQLNTRVVGPSSVTPGRVVVFDGGTGKLVKQTAASLSDAGNFNTGGGTISAGAISGTSIEVTGSIESNAFSGGFAVVTSGDALAEATATTTEIDYLSGVTGPIQGQLDNKVETSLVGAPDGLATLDGGGKVPVSQLPNSIMEYQGTWNASTNTPTLADGAGNTGDVYRVTVAGTQNLGSGNITFDVGDYVIYNTGGVWEKSDTTDAVASVNGQTGNITIDTDGEGLEVSGLTFSLELDGTTLTKASSGVRVNQDLSIRRLELFNDDSTSNTLDVYVESTSAPLAIWSDNAANANPAIYVGNNGTSSSVYAEGYGSGDIVTSVVAAGGSGRNLVLANDTDQVGISTQSGTTSYDLLLPSAQGGSGTVLTNNGSGTLSWTSVATDPTTTRGDLIRRGAAALERLPAATDNRVVAGDGTDVVSKQIDDPNFFTTGAEVTQSLPGVVKSAGQLLGTNTNDDAASGYVGQIISAYRSRNNGLDLTNSTAVNVTNTPGSSITLTEGDWMVTAMAGIDPNTTVTATILRVSVSTTSATSADPNTQANPFISNGECRTIFNWASGALTSDVVLTIPSYRVTVANGATLVLYLVVEMDYSAGDANTYGAIWARRVR